MVAVNPPQLIEAILDGIQESGESGLLISPLRAHPRKIVISKPDGSSYSLWVYAWTLTPGGRPQLKNEYRIQMTTVTPPLPLNPEGLTVLIGYEPSLKMFAGFDLTRHGIFTKGSPSVQIDITSLHKALQDGLAFDRKDNSEIAVAIRPDQFLAYACNAGKLHQYGRDAITENFFNKAASLKPIRLLDISSLSTGRQRVIRTISQLSRDANFRRQVLAAYEKRCAVTRAQLRLIEAAHILPVGVPGSADHVSNGISLSPTFHRAFDRALIYLDKNFQMKINPKVESDLLRLNLDGGLTAFRSVLGKIHLPSDRRQWPDLHFIKRANEYRRIEL